MTLIQLAEARLVPDLLIRYGIRRLLARRLKKISSDSTMEKQFAVRRFAETLRQDPVAIDTQAANDQHYEVPAAFFENVLGPRLKYSCCLFEEPGSTLADAEKTMLRLTCERAELSNGMRTLELGCGWGSLTIWIAQNYPDCHITAVSNSSSQRKFIESRARDLGLKNVCVITADMRTFDTDLQYDRVISVEMFEHMRNYELLFRRIARWLKPEGKLFAHVFCHREFPYAFQTEGADNWMGRHFFTGGIMPAIDLFHEFNRDLTVTRQWQMNGSHYWRTCEAWLKNLDTNYEKIIAILEPGHPSEAKRIIQRWRMFFMACAELFRFQAGEEWFVAHFQFSRRAA
ncbi:MAG: cyclopropane-fatty-acyl-phospholipid synthase family protein [Pirellulales bacterium]|nr:cyclopropane-fatty-acyl-phospholipid synthase family protein [Pirellulales bacterium]